MKPGLLENHKIAFIPGKCIKCGICEGDCPQMAIHPETESIDSNCIICDHCVAVCPSAAISVNNNVPDDLKPIAITSDDFIALLKAKRSVRRYAQKSVEPEKIQLLIEAFKWVPTAKNARQSFVTVVSGENILLLDEKVCLTLNKTFRRLFNPLTKPMWYLIAGKKARSFFNTGKRFIERQQFQSNIITHNAPLVLLFHAPVSIMGNGPMDNNIAASYLALYASVLGLGTCYNGYIVSAFKQNKKLNQQFNIPGHHQVYSALLVGYPKYRYLREVVR